MMDFPYHLPRLLVERARIFATAAHAAVGQLRKYTFEPYITHPLAVAKLVATVQHTPEMLAAALLHDVVEDTKIEIEDIHREFGGDVTDLVWCLTDISKKSDGNRAIRKAIDRAHLANAPPQAQTIKLADIIDNTKTIDALDPDFAKVFKQEKVLLLEVMNKGDPVLMKIALDQCK